MAREMLLYEPFECLALYDITPPNFVNLIAIKSHRDVKWKSAAQGREWARVLGLKKKTWTLGLFCGELIWLDSNSIKNIQI